MDKAAPIAVQQTQNDDCYEQQIDRRYTHAKPTLLNVEFFVQNFAVQKLQCY
jgi:hypothetical protein